MLQPVGFVRRSRTALTDDRCGDVDVRIEIVDTVIAESLDGVKTFFRMPRSVVHIDRVDEAKMEWGSAPPA